METVMLGMAILVLLVQLVLVVLLGMQVPRVLRDLRESKAQWDLLVHKDRRVKEVLLDRKARRDLQVKYPPSGSTQ
jgi:hypothetical protein